MTPSEQDNLSRWDGQRRGFYEVWYLKLNDLPSQTALWVRYTLRIPTRAGEAPQAELWGIFFDAADPELHAAGKRSLPLEPGALDRDAFSIRVGDAQLTHDRAHGELETPSGPLVWDLRWLPPHDAVRLFPYERMYEGGFPKTKFLSPAFDVPFEGTVRIGEREIVLQGARGQQTHIWGVKHAEHWSWAHCNIFEDAPGASFEALTARIRVGPGVRSPALTVIHLEEGGERYTFNQPSELLWRNRSRDRLGRWEFSATRGDLRLAGEITAPIRDMVGVGYQDPDGETLVCHNSKLGSAHLQRLRRGSDGRWRLESRLIADRTMAIELVDRHGDKRVPVAI